MDKEKKILLVIFLSSLSTLAYEIVLTRIFSISLWYHFAFMIISIAMLGIGASGTILSLCPKLKTISNIPIYSLFLGIGITMSYLLSNQIVFDPVKLSWDKMQLFYIALYYIFLSIPFFFTGLIIAVTFSFLSEKSGMVYGADLLGAGIGSIGILFLLTKIPPEKDIFILSILALVGALIIGRNAVKIISILLILANVFFYPLLPLLQNSTCPPIKDLS